MLKRFAPQLYAVLRFVAGVLFLMHGTQKLLNWPPGRGGGGGGDMPPMMLAAGVIEIVGGLLIALGLFTSIAAFIASGEMAAAYFIAHAPEGPIPLLNRGELAALYCFLFLYIAANGAGVWAIDSRRRKRRGYLA